jgi:hypothetical protein
MHLWNHEIESQPERNPPRETDKGDIEAKVNPFVFSFGQRDHAMIRSK